MAHDEWRASLRINHDNPTALTATLTELPADGLQHAGNAILGHLTDPALRAIAAEPVAALTDRDWAGDLELAAALLRHLDNTPSSLTPVPVDLEELGEALDETPGVESLLHLDTGTVWPGGILDLGEEPDGYDPEDPGRWLPFTGEAPTPPTETWNASPPPSATILPLQRWRGPSAAREPSPGSEAPSTATRNT